MDEHYFQWVPNFYIILVAPPGVAGKTTTVSIGGNMLREIEDINFGPNVITWQQLVTSMANAKQLLPIGDTPIVTAEDMLNQMYYEQCAVTYISGELGNLLDPKDRDMVDALVALWDAQEGPWSKETKTQGADVINNPAISILACTTPAWIRESFPPYFIHGGLASRCIFVFADKKRKLVAYPSTQVKDRQEAEDYRKKLVEDLQDIHNMMGEFGLTPEAITWGENWYKNHWDDSVVDDHMKEVRYGGYRARKQTHLHKIAMILSAAKRSDRVVRLEDLQEANKLLDVIEPSMMKVFEHIGMSDDTRGLSEIIQATRLQHKIAKSDLFRALSHTLSLKQFDEALNAGVAAGYIRLHQAGDTLYVIYKEGQDEEFNSPAEDPQQ
jgi:hypothetical protein